MTGHPRLRKTIRLCDAAEQIGMAQRDALSLIRRGLFCPVYRISKKHWRVDPEELADWLAARRVTAPAHQGSIRRPGFDRQAARTARSGQQSA